MRGSRGKGCIIAKTEICHIDICYRHRIDDNRDFIEERLNDNLAAHIEKATKGHGGKREGAGRPKGSKKEAKKRVYLPNDVAEWFEQPSAIPQVRQLIAKGKH